MKYLSVVLSVMMLLVFNNQVFAKKLGADEIKKLFSGATVELSTRGNNTSIDKYKADGSLESSLEKRSGVDYHTGKWWVDSSGKLCRSWPNRRGGGSFCREIFSEEGVIKPGRDGRPGRNIWEVKK